MPPSIHLLISLFLSLSATAQHKWPTGYTHQMQEKVVRVDSEAGDRLYHTRHFSLHVSSNINQRDLKQCALITESVQAALQSLPLPLTAAKSKPQRFPIFLFPDETTFSQAGGPVGAAGYYDWKQKHILLRGDLLFPQSTKQKTSPLDTAKYQNLLVHELTHLCMRDQLAYLPVWFSEGMAEYMAVSHRSGGSYRFPNHSRELVKHLKLYLPQLTTEPNKAISLPSLNTLLRFNHRSWQHYAAESSIEERYLPYASALLLTHALFHNGEATRKATREWVSQLTSKPNLSNSATEKLLPSEKREALEKKLTSYWKKQGLHIQFEE